MEDLDEALATLRQRGVPVGEPRTGTSGARIYFIEDPDGNKIELAELNASSQTRQAPPSLAGARSSRTRAEG